MIGTVGSEEKAELAGNGCDHVILYRDEDFAAREKEITGGEGVPVVYDGVGKATFPGSLDWLKPFGMLVSFGSASGPIEAFNIGILAQKGSLYVTRPTLMTHMRSARPSTRSRRSLFEVVGRGRSRIPIHSRASWRAEAVRRALEGRETARRHHHAPLKSSEQMRG